MLGFIWEAKQPKIIYYQAKLSPKKLLMSVNNRNQPWSLFPESVLNFSKYMRNKFWREVAAAWGEYKPVT